MAHRLENSRANLAAAISDRAETLAEISHVNKSYGGKPVVQDVSFTLEKGEVLGLVGPNGAGKTTTIRMLMDIVKPDSGEISVFGSPLNEQAKNKIGYLPEERGLYRKMKVSDNLIYLASLKNVPSSIARKRAEKLLSEVDMSPHKGKKIGELSRGMGQIIQFLVTIAHDPSLIVLDEPFAGLDPVNRMLLKNIILELKKQGKTVILSTHMMNEVEEMCDRVLMINRGRVVLYGNLSEVKRRFRNNSVFIQCDGDVGIIEGVTGSKDHGKYIELFLDGQTTSQQILNKLISKGVRIDRFEVSTPSLNEIFIQVVKQ
jgi:ABC-2 type transport system ATP-binding protein